MPAFAAMLLFVLITQWDAFAVYLVLPVMGADLATNQDVLAWVVTAAMLASVALKFAAGWVGDRLGLRRLVVTGYVGYALASAACAMAATPTQLIAARIGQGVTGALVMTGGLALLASNTKPERRGRAIALAFGLGGIATVAGPVIGGLLADAASWRYVFWVEVPAAILGAIIASRTTETVHKTTKKSQPVHKNRALLRVIAAGSLGNAAIVLVLFATPWLLNGTATANGALMSVCSAALAVGIAISDRLTKLSLAHALVVAGIALLVTPLSLVAGVAVAAFALGVVNGWTIVVAMSTVPLERAGEAAGLTKTAITLAGAIAPAVAGSNEHALLVAAALCLAGAVSARVRARS